MLLGGFCVTDAQCASGLVCNRDTNACVDQRVTACGCRVAGQRSTPNAVWVLVGLLVVAAGRRRQRQ
jgi:MYXO-CTERM domain-containing protein